MRCIFCLNEAEAGTKEHVFPEAIGGRLAIFDVCRPCNSRLGDVADGPLANHFLVQARRMALDVRGKGSRRPNPLFQGELRGTENRSVHFVVGDRLSEARARLVPSVKVDEVDGGIQFQASVDRRDREKLPEMVNRALKRQGLPPMSTEAIEAACAEETIEQPTIRWTPTIDMVRFHRGLLKIAYEMAWRWLGEAYLADPTAALLRGIVFDEDFATWGSRFPLEYGVTAMVNESTTSWPWRHVEPHNHFAFSASRDNNIAVSVEVFGVFQCTVVVTREADAYDPHEWMFLSCDPEAGTLRESTLFAEVERATRLGHYRDPDAGVP